MLKITKELRDLLVAKCGMPADADDAAVHKAVADALIAGTITRDEVSAATVDKQLNQVKELQDNVNRLTGLVEKLVEKGQSVAVEKTVAEKPAEKTSVGNVAMKALRAGLETAESAGSNIVVKNAIERYSDNRSLATWDKSANEYQVKAFGGQSIVNNMKGFDAMAGGIDMPTDKSLVVAGVWFKHLINKQCRSEGKAVPWQFKMSEEDTQILAYIANEGRFVGPLGYQGTPCKSINEFNPRETDNARHWLDGQRLKDLSDGDYWIKATQLLDDAGASGGLEAVPIEFDSNFILTPLLNGELFPLVDVVNVSRRRQEGVKIGNPTLGWGTAEGTAITPFTTDSFISAFDNTIYPVVGALELGRDFQSDSPLAIGQIIVRNYGEQFKKELDNVIANGNGTNRPEGLFVASGTTVVSSVNSGGSPEVGDYEGLMFAIGKEFLQEAGMPPNSRAVFLGTQTAYQRARSIAVNSANDARRIFGMDSMSYRLFDFKYAINASAGNSYIGFFCLNRYRMYRRQGLEVRMIDGDVYSGLRNTQTIIVRARFGGALTHSSAGAKITDAKA